MDSQYFDFSAIKKIDSLDMFAILKNFPVQVKEAKEIGKNAPIFNNGSKASQFIVLGMGGSAIGGDLLKSYSNSTNGANHLQISTNRSYTIPNTIDNNTCIIASSFSGNTEETITAFEAVRNRTENIICISSGGELCELANKYGIPVVKIPGGMQPRCALGYSFFPMLYLLMRSGAFKSDAIDETEAAIEELIDTIEKKSNLYSSISDDNPAIMLASQIHGHIPVIYSAIERTETINFRWRGQIQENAKNFAFGNYLPEMNHNEINSYSYPDELSKRFIILFLKDKDDHPKVKIRFDALESILKDSVSNIISSEGKGEHLLTRMFDLIYLGDWVSYYLAILNGVDPTPIPLITKLKNFLSGTY